MNVGLLLEPQEGGSFDDLLVVVARAQAAGFDRVLLSEHLLPLNDAACVSGPFDVWTALAGLALAGPQGITIGTLVSPVTFRHPAILARMAAQVASLARGRLAVGVGAGWNRREHDAAGLPFPELYDRIDLVASAVRMLSIAWDDERSRRDPLLARASPGTACRPSMIVGGTSPRLIRVAAEFADELNIGFVARRPMEQAVEFARRSSAGSGRALTLSAAATVCVGTSAAAWRSRIATAEHAGQTLAGALVGTPLKVPRHEGVAGPLGGPGSRCAL